jgi:hypothetical protein
MSRPLRLEFSGEFYHAIRVRSFIWQSWGHPLVSSGQAGM